jgi:hypothetical protein
LAQHQYQLRAFQCLNLQELEKVEGMNLQTESSSAGYHPARRYLVGSTFKQALLSGLIDAYRPSLAMFNHPMLIGKCFEVLFMVGTLVKSLNGRECVWGAGTVSERGASLKMVL